MRRFVRFVPLLCLAALPASARVAPALTGPNPLLAPLEVSLPAPQRFDVAPCGFYDGDADERWRFTSDGDQVCVDHWYDQPAYAGLGAPEGREPVYHRFATDGGASDVLRLPIASAEILTYCRNGTSRQHLWWRVHASACVPSAGWLGADATSLSVVTLNPPLVGTPSGEGRETLHVDLTR